MLGKWRWGILNYQGKFWQKIIKSKYGYVGQGGESGRRGGNFSKGSIWWRDLGTLDNCILGAQNWFSQCVDKVVGNGSSTLFWHDLWSDMVPLSVKYQRLYSINNEKMTKVDKLGTWSGDT